MLFVADACGVHMATNGRRYKVARLITIFWASHYHLYNSLYHIIHKKEIKLLFSNSFISYLFKLCSIKKGFPCVVANSFGLWHFSNAINAKPLLLLPQKSLQLFLEPLSTNYFSSAIAACVTAKLERKLFFNSN